jgi:hypothetical protein
VRALRNRPRLKVVLNRCKHRLEAFACVTHREAKAGAFAYVTPSGGKGWSLRLRDPIGEAKAGAFDYAWEGEAKAGAFAYVTPSGGKGWSLRLRDPIGRQRLEPSLT